MTPPSMHRDDAYREHRDRLVRLFTRKFGFEDAEDIAQETLARFVANPPADMGDRDPWPWLSVVARNVGCDIARARSRMTLVETEDLDDLMARVPDGLHEVLSQESVAALEEVTRQLTPQQWLVLRLRGIDGWSFAQIAERTRMTENAVRQQLLRARRRAAELITEQAGQASGLVAFVVRAWRGARDHIAARREAFAPALSAASVVGSAGVSAVSSLLYAGALTLAPATATSAHAQPGAAVPVASSLETSVPASSGSARVVRPGGVPHADPAHPTDRAVTTSVNTEDQTVYVTSPAGEGGVGQGQTHNADKETPSQTAIREVREMLPSLP